MLLVDDLRDAGVGEPDDLPDLAEAEAVAARLADCVVPDGACLGVAGDGFPELGLGVHGAECKGMLTTKRVESKLYDMHYVISIPTYPEPTLSRDDQGEVRTFATRAEAQAAIDEADLLANVERRKAGS